MKKTTIVMLVLLISFFRLDAQVSVAENKGVNIYTNPSADVINIKASNDDIHLALDLYDIYGKKVFTKTFYGNTGRIAASQLATGTYTVVIYSKGNLIRTQKIQID